MSQIPSDQLRPNDKYLDRNRAARWGVLIGYVVLLGLLCILLSWKLASDWFGFGIGGVLFGTALWALILSFTLNRFLVRVALVSAFITVDLLATFFHNRTEGLPSTSTLEEETPAEKELDRITFPVYLPGLHPAFPWESREKNYNFSLKEVSADLSLKILLLDGPVTLKGSYRIRPDFKNLIPFLSGVATSADELQELISAFAFGNLGGKTVDDATKHLDQLNKDLYAEFGLAKDAGGNPLPASPIASKFERRFGVFVGDVTIASILPSEEVQRTRGSINEAKAIAEGTAILLGYPNKVEFEAAQRDGKVTADQISRARDRFLSISKNLEGMELKRSEIDINLGGLDPEVIKALGAFAAMYAEATANKKGK